MELDTYVNMPVVGRYLYVISDTGQIADVNPFTPDYQSMKIPIVYAAIQYNCPCSGVSYIFVIKNEFHVPSMSNNVLPPFILKESGVRVSDTPKIQMDDPTVDHQSIYLPENSFRIPLLLWGIFSYFPSIQPTAANKKKLRKYTS